MSTSRMPVGRPHAPPPPYLPPDPKSAPRSVLRLATDPARRSDKKDRKGAPIGYVLNRDVAHLKPVLDEILELERFGFDVHVFFVDRNFPGYARWIAHEVSERRIEHLHAHLATVDVARHVKRLTHIGYSFTLAGPNPFAAGPDLTSLRDHAREADFVVAPSETSRRELLSAMGPAMVGRVFRIYRGVDVERFPFSPEAGRQADAILAAGPLVQASGFDDLIDAIAILRDRRPERIRLTIAGAGPSAPKLKATITARHLEDRVELVAADNESNTHPTLTDLMRVHAIMALPYRRLPGSCDGAVPAVLLEAMAMGLPVVSTSLDGMREIIDDGWNGRLITPRQPHWLAGALETLLDNVRLRVRIATNAREDVEQSFNQAVNASELARLLSMAAVEHRTCAREVV